MRSWLITLCAVCSQIRKTITFELTAFTNYKIIKILFYSFKTGIQISHFTDGEAKSLLLIDKISGPSVT